MERGGAGAEPDTADGHDAEAGADNHFRYGNEFGDEFEHGGEAERLHDDGCDESTGDDDLHDTQHDNDNDSDDNDDGDTAGVHR